MTPQTPRVFIIVLIVCFCCSFVYANDAFSILSMFAASNAEDAAKEAKEKTETLEKRLDRIEKKLDILITELKEGK